MAGTTEVAQLLQLHCAAHAVDDARFERARDAVAEYLCSLLQLADRGGSADSNELAVTLTACLEDATSAFAAERGRTEFSQVDGDETAEKERVDAVDIRDTDGDARYEALLTRTAGLVLSAMCQAGCIPARWLMREGDGKAMVGETEESVLALQALRRQLATPVETDPEGLSGASLDAFLLLAEARARALGDILKGFEFGDRRRERQVPLVERKRRLQLCALLVQPWNETTHHPCAPLDDPQVLPPPTVQCCINTLWRESLSGAATLSHFVARQTSATLAEFLKVADSIRREDGPVDQVGTNPEVDAALDLALITPSSEIGGTDNVGGSSFAAQLRVAANVANCVDDCGGFGWRIITTCAEGALTWLRAAAESWRSGTAKQEPSPLASGGMWWLQRAQRTPALRNTLFPVPQDVVEVASGLGDLIEAVTGRGLRLSINIASCVDSLKQLAFPAGLHGDSGRQLPESGREVIVKAIVAVLFAEALNNSVNSVLLEVCDVNRDTFLGVGLTQGCSWRMRCFARRQLLALSADRRSQLSPSFLHALLLFARGILFDPKYWVDAQQSRGVALAAVRLLAPTFVADDDSRKSLLSLLATALESVRSRPFSDVEHVRLFSETLKFTASFPDADAQRARLDCLALLGQIPPANASATDLIALLDIQHAVVLDLVQKVCCNPSSGPERCLVLLCAIPWTRWLRRGIHTKTLSSSSIHIARNLVVSDLIESLAIFIREQHPSAGDLTRLLNVILEHGVAPAQSTELGLTLHFVQLAKFEENVGLRAAASVRRAALQVVTELANRLDFQHDLPQVSAALVAIGKTYIIQGLEDEWETRLSAVHAIGSVVSRSLAKPILDSVLMQTVEWLVSQLVFGSEHDPSVTVRLECFSSLQRVLMKVGPAAPMQTQIHSLADPAFEHSQCEQTPFGNIPEILATVPFEHAQELLRPWSEVDRVDAQLREEGATTECY